MSAKPEINADDMVNIEINGVAMKAAKGSMIIHAADDANVYIPRFCYHKKLPIAANCRMCLVEVENVPKPLPACATPVNEGMKVFTNSDYAKKAQQGVMEFLLINHPLDCPICDQGGECELQDIAMGYGRSVSRFAEKKRIVKDKNIGPLIATEMTRCIHCTRCIRTIELVGGEKELGGMGRGTKTLIGTYIERSVNSEMSGNVIDVCPVGALTAKPSRFAARAWEMRSTAGIAGHDCIGSNINTHIRNKEIVRVVPAENEKINEVWISDRDRYAYEGLNSDSRLTTPMIKVNGEWQETDWNTALEEVVEGLRANNANIAGLMSPNVTTEEAFLMQKLLRDMGATSIDHRIGQQDFSDDGQASLASSLGSSIEALESIGAALLIGSNIRHDQPIASHRLRKAAANGAKVMLLNSIDFDINFPIAELVITHPSALATDLAAMVKVALEQSSSDAPDGINALINDVIVTDSHKDIVANLNKAGSSSVIIGAHAMALPDLSVIRQLAELLATLTNSQIGYLPRGANSVGASLAGAVPFAGVGGKEVSAGSNAVSMFETSASAYMLMNVEPEHDCINPVQATCALKAAEFVVCLSSFVSDAMRDYADVLLPTAPYSETSGTFVNAAGTWQRFSANCAPLGETRPAWKVLRVLGNLLDLNGYEYLSSEEVRAEVERDAGQVKLDNSQAWQCPSSLAAISNGIVRIADLPIYAVDSVVRRAAALQQTIHAASETIAMNQVTADKLSVSDATRVVVAQGDDEISGELNIDARIADDCVLVSSSTVLSSGLGSPYQTITVTKD